MLEMCRSGTRARIIHAEPLEEGLGIGDTQPPELGGASQTVWS